MGVSRLKEVLFNMIDKMVMHAKGVWAEMPSCAID